MTSFKKLKKSSSKSRALDLSKGWSFPMRNKSIPSLVFLFSALLASSLFFSASNSYSQDDDAAKESDPDKDRVILVPFRELGKTLEGTGSTAIIPYQEYLKLKANGATPEKKQPPVQAVISKADYSATVEGGLAKIAVKFEVSSLVDEWATLPVRFGAAAVGSWESNTKGVLLKGGKKGEYQFLLPKKGNYSLTLELLAKVKTSPEGQSFQMDCPSVGITTLDVTIPKADQTINLLPQLVSLDTEAEAGKTKLKASLGATESITIQWSPKVSDKPQMELLSSVTNLSQVTIRDNLVYTDTIFQYEILRGELEEIRFVVPAGYRILDVTSDAKVKGWNVKKEDSRQLVTLPLLSPATKSLNVEVHTESDLSEDDFSIFGLKDKDAPSGIHTLDTLRESGQIVVLHDSGLEVSISDRQGLTRIDSSEINKKLKTSAKLAYKYYTSDAELVIKTKPVLPKISVTSSTQATFEEEELKTITRLTYSIQRAGLFSVDIKVPENLIIDQLACPGMKSWNHDEDNSTLSIVFLEKKEGTVSPVINAHLEFDDESKERELNIPILEPVSVERETGNVLIYAPDSMEVVTQRDKVVAAQPISLSANPRVIQKIAQRLPISAWSFSRRPVTIPVKTVSKPSRLSAEVGTSVAVRQDVVEVSTVLNYKVEFAGVDTFRFNVPESVSKSLQVELSGKISVGIQQKTPAEKAENGLVLWTITLQRPTTGNVKFQVTYEIPIEKPSEEEVAAASPLTIQPIQPLGLEADEEGGKATPLSKLTGQIGVSKEQAISVSAKVSQGEAEAIDVRELTMIKAKSVTGFRYYRSDNEKPLKIEITSQKFDIQEVVRTVVSRARVEMVLGQDDTARYRCRFRIQSSERQRLPLMLPKAAEPYSITVDNKQLSLEKSDLPVPEGWEAFYLNVARTKPSDESFDVAILFSWPINPAPFQYWQGKLQLPIPKIGQFNEGDTAVQQIRISVWVPKKYSLVGEPKQFSIANQSIADESWIQNEGDDQLDFPTEGVAYHYTNLGGAVNLKVTWWNRTGFTVVLSALVALIGLILIRTSWENKIGFLILLGLAVVLWAQVNPDMAIHAVTSARFGIFTLLGLWVIHSIANWGHYLRSPNTESTQTNSKSSVETSAPENHQEEQHNEEHHSDDEHHHHD